MSRSRLRIEWHFLCVEKVYPTCSFCMFYRFEPPIPTISPLIILLLYCHINGFQRSSSAEKPLPGGAKRMDGRAAHPVAGCGDGVVSIPVCSIVVSLIARGCLIGATG